MSGDGRVKDIFGKALEVEPGARAEFVHRACEGDEAVRARVEGLLAAHDRGAGFMGGHTQDTAGGVGMGGLAAAGERPGEVIGPYKLLQVIGEGGFGVVYMAEQDRPLRRRVALKVIKLGMDTRAVIARFEAERQALAMMDHPNIARVLDAGATGAGRPFFVMELVKGEAITAYCNRNTLTIDDRLDLFTQVCRAVQHAHTKGVIHRDLKPSNILVSTQDGRAFAKVIDFGIAKATSVRLTEKTLFTEFRQFIGTPEYMSPEQAEGSLDVDTRTDVYALGVLLYELLTGATPFDGRRLRSAAYDEIRRIIREDEPERPSTRLSRSTDTLPSVAAQRRTVPARLGTMIRGDLDWIVMKCLEKDRSRRYETAESLAADLDRHLRGQAVLAAPPAVAYRVRKFVGRHRGAVGTGAAILIALVIGAGVAVAGYISAVRARDAETLERNRADAARTDAQHQAEEARRQADRARHEAAKAGAVNGFFQKLLRGVDPEQAHADRDVTVRELVDRSATGLENGELADQPEVEAAVRATIGELYRALGDPAQARRHIARAIELGEAGALSRAEMAAVRSSLGETLRDLGDVDGAEAAYLKAVDDAVAAEGGASATVGSLYNNLGGVAMKRGDLDRAEELFNKSLRILRGLTGPSDRRLLQVKWNLAVLASERGDRATAETLIRQVTEQGVTEFTADDPLAAGALRNLAVTVGNQHRFKEAVGLAQRAVDSFRRIDGDTHPATLDALAMLGDIAYAGGDYAVAERAYREILDGRRALPEEQRGNLIKPIRDLCNALEPMARAAEAEPLRRETLEIVRAGDDKADLAGVLGNVGFNLICQGRWADAEAPLRECLDIRQGLYPPGHPRYWSTMNGQSMVGEAILGQAQDAMPSDPGRAAELFAEAEALIVPAGEFLATDPAIPAPMPGQPDLRANALARGARLYRSWAAIDPSMAAKADQWQARVDARVAARWAAEPEPMPAGVSGR